MSVIANLFSAAMYAFVLQNLIFTGGYGASEAVRMAAKLDVLCREPEAMKRI